MELKLNIYAAGRVDKTYVTNEFDLMFGTVEDFVNLIDLDAFDKNADNLTFATAALNLVTGSFDKVKDLLKEVFPGLTDEELKRTRVKEVTPLLMQIVKYSLTEIASVGKGKN